MAELIDDVRTIPGFRGRCITPGDPDYDSDRAVFNGMIDRRPALLARCGSAEDVAAVVRHAAALAAPLTVYGGGHAVTGHAVADGAMCLDLRGMKRVSVDPVTRTVRAQAGLTWGELDAACQAHGLAVTGGRVSTTGIGGLALGSGSGWLERSLGFACDNLLEAEVVTADGRILRTSRMAYPDLFWALRGGGGNFGVVTEFTFRLHPVGPLLLGGLLLYPAAVARELLTAWRDLMLSAPPALGSGLAFLTAPPADFVPEPVRGTPVVGIVICWNGLEEDGRAVLAPFLAAMPPAVDMVQVLPYVALQQLLDPANPKGMQNYWSGDFFDSLPDEAVAVLAERATRPASPLTQIILVAGGGAVAQVPDDETAFGSRTAAFNIHYLGMWADPADSERNITSIRALCDAMRPWTSGAVYLNFLGDEGPSRIEAGFGAAKYSRLREIKRTWDPTNLFRFNQNIPPAD